MADTVKLAVPGDKPDRRVVEALEHALALARAGDLREVAIYGTLKSSEFYTSVRYVDGLALVGALSSLQFQIMRRMADCGR